MMMGLLSDMQYSTLNSHLSHIERQTTWSCSDIYTKEYLSSSSVVPGTEEANERLATAAAAESYQLSGGIEL